MIARQKYRLSIITLSLYTLLWASGAWAVTSTWICGTGDYSDITCWDPLRSMPPYNRPSGIFDVVIPSGSGTISMDVNVNPCEVNSFILGKDRTFQVPHGRSYMVADQGEADIGGIIHCNGGHFIAQTATFSDNEAQVWVEGGAMAIIGATSYSSTGLYGNAYYDGRTWIWPLFTSSGQGTILDLSALQRIYANTDYNDRRSMGDIDINIQKIIADNGGVIDLSNLDEIIVPVQTEDYIQFNVDGVNSIIDMRSLQRITGISGSANFDIRNGGMVLLGNVTNYVNTSITLNGASSVYIRGLHALKTTTIALNDANDLLEIDGDFDLGDNIMVSNSGKANLAIGGDMTYAHKDETKVPFGKSYVFVNGKGPQEVEVGGEDVGVYIEELANDNFGFGQMVVGRNKPDDGPAVVFLVDQIDNGNHYDCAEALYLFGTDDEPCGLRLLNGSILYMGGLKVYAMLDGVVTDLTTLFGPDELMIPFDEGWLCLDRPQVNDSLNQARNGGFETGINPPTTENHVVTLSEGSTDIDFWMVTKDTMNWTHETFAADSTFHDGERYADLSSSETGKGAVSQDIPTVPGRLYHVWFDMANNPLAEGTAALRVSAADCSEEFIATRTEWQTKTWRFVAKDDVTILTFEGIDDPNTPFGVLIDNVIVMDMDRVDPDGSEPLTVQITNIDTSNCPRIQASVIVTNLNNEAVLDLDKSNFSVYEEGALRTPIDVELSTSSVSASLALDYSASMEETAMEALEFAAAGFVNLMNEGDMCEIIKFANGVEVTQEYTHEVNELLDAIQSTPNLVRNETYLYRAIHQAISDTAGQSGSKAVIAMSDGRDSDPDESATKVIDHALAEDIPVFTIGLGDQIDEAVLIAIATQTGGIYYHAPDPNDLAEIYERIAGTLSNQYLVTYDTVICYPGNSGDVEYELNIHVEKGTASGLGSMKFRCPLVCGSGDDN